MDIKKFDIFGVDIGLRYMNQSNHKSKFGAIFSQIIMLLVCVQIYLVGQELFKKENPEVIQSERFVALPERFNMTKTSFNFAIGPQYSGNYSHFIDESIYTIDAILESFVKVYNDNTQQYEQVWTINNIAVRPCTLEKFGLPETQKYFANLPGVDRMNCLDQESSSIYIEGNFDQDRFSNLKIFIRLCDDKKANCRPKTEIIDTLTSSYVAYYGSNTIVNPKNIDPFHIVGQDTFWSVSPIYPKDAFIYYRNIYVESDKGIFFEDKSYDRAMSLSYINEQIIFGESEYYFSACIRFEKAKETVINRKYKKLDSVLAEIGGISKALMIIGFIICIPVNRLCLHSQLSNLIFNFGSEDEGKTNFYKNDIFLNKIENEDHIMKNFSSAIQADISKIEKQHQINKPQTNEVITSIYNQSVNQNCQVQDRRSKQFQQIISNKCETESFTSNSQNTPCFQPLNSNQKQLEAGQNLSQLIQMQQMRSLLTNQTQQYQENGSICIQYDKEKQKKKQNHSVEPIEQTSSNKFNEKNQNMIQIKSMFKVNENENALQFDLKWTDYIRYYLWPFGEFQKKKKQIDYSVEKIYQHLDMLYIVKKFVEIERLKAILLDDDQINLIQFLPKPRIDVNLIDTKKLSYQFSDTGTFTSSFQPVHSSHLQLSQKKCFNLQSDVQNLTEKERAHLAFDSLKCILKKPQLSQLDRKIINMLDSSMLDHIVSNKSYLQKLEIQQNQLLQNTIHYKQEDQLENKSLDKSIDKFLPVFFQQKIEKKEQEVNLTTINQQKILDSDIFSLMSQKSCSSRLTNDNGEGDEGPSHKNTCIHQTIRNKVQHPNLLNENLHSIKCDVSSSSLCSSIYIPSETLWESPSRKVQKSKYETRNSQLTI